MGHVTPYSLLPLGDTKPPGHLGRPHEVTQHVREDVHGPAVVVCFPEEAEGRRRAPTRFTGVATLTFSVCHFLLLSRPAAPSRAPGARDASASPCLLPAPSQRGPGLALVNLGAGARRGRVTRPRSQTWGSGRARPTVPYPSSLPLPDVLWRPRLQPPAAPEEARPLTLLSLHPVLQRHWGP